jgi:predicted nucleic acid-binding protein
MGFLLDTDVISMLSPVRNTVPALFLDWLEQMDRENRVFLSVVTIHEMEKGIALLDSKGATAKAADLNRPIAHEGRADERVCGRLVTEQ